MYPKTIRTDEDHKAALERIEQIFNAEPGTPEGEELDLLATLVCVYEKEQFPIGPPDPISAIRFRMEQAGLRQADLIPYIGSRSKVSEILSGKRNLSLSMIRALHKGLGIPAEVLLQEIKPSVEKKSPKRRKSLVRKTNLAAKSMRKRPVEKTTPSRATRKNNRKSS